jgi:hypothetical protein
MLRFVAVAALLSKVKVEKKAMAWLGRVLTVGWLVRVICALFVLRMAK